MKRYFLNIHTDSHEGVRERVELSLLFCFLAVALVCWITIPGLLLILAIPAVILIGFTAFIVIRMFGYSFCFDDNKKVIILNIFGKKKESIPIERVGRVIRSKNKDYRKGAVEINDRIYLFCREIFVAESKDGTPYFYFIADAETFKFFKRHGIPILNVYEGVTIDISDRY